MTTVYLVRHAHADFGPDEARPLSAAGEKSARVLAERMAGLMVRAIYSSPSPRAVDTVGPLADHLRLTPYVIADLRERELPVVAADRFDDAARATWLQPAAAPPGGETNDNARARGLGVIRALVERHAGEDIVASTHGTLLALILNGLNAAYGYEFWRRLSFPDIYAVGFVKGEAVRVWRIWSPALNAAAMDDTP